MALMLKNTPNNSHNNAINTNKTVKCINNVVITKLHYNISHLHPIILLRAHSDDKY